MRRSVALGLYLVGSVFVMLGFFAGAGRPCGPPATSPGPSAGWCREASARWMTPAERRDQISSSALFITLGLDLLAVGIAVDRRHGWSRRPRRSCVNKWNWVFWPKQPGLTFSGMAASQVNRDLKPDRTGCERARALGSQALDGPLSELELRRLTRTSRGARSATRRSAGMAE